MSGGGPPADRAAGTGSSGDDGWPVPVDGVTEAVVATPTSDGDWAIAALGLHPGDPVTARTWGRTRTRRNLDRRLDGASGPGEREPAPDAFDPEIEPDATTPPAVIQFVADPVAFVRAALGRWTASEPVVDAAAAWVAVGVSRQATGTEAGTEWADWALHPGSSAVCDRQVPTIRRGTNAVIEATIAASRLGVPGESDETLRERLDRHAALIRRIGSDRDRAALAKIVALTEDWTPSDD